MLNTKDKSLLKMRNNSMTVAESLAVPTISVENALIKVIGEKYEEPVRAMLGEISKLDLPTVSLNDIKKFGFSATTANKVFGALQFALALNKQSSQDVETVRSPEDAAKLFMHLQFEKQEHFAIAALNTKNQVLSKEVIFIGSLNASIVHPREVFQKLLKINGVASFIAYHNHPSGNPNPSPEDIDVTTRLWEAGNLVGLDCVDHIIIGDGTYLSMKEQGYF